MGPAELLREGKPDEALAALKDQIRKNPADDKLRMFLAQLLSVLGQWDAAADQYDVAAEMNGQHDMARTMARTAILCEKLRAEVFSGRKTALVLGEPEPWIAWMVQAQALEAQGKADAAAELRSKAFDEAPATPGDLDVGPNEQSVQTHAFEWIADADPRLGPMIEAVVEGKYYWVPWKRVLMLRVEPPTDLRDTVWTPAQFVWTAGGASVALVPTRYPGSEAASRGGKVRLARETVWDESARRPCPTASVCWRPTRASSACSRCARCGWATRRRSPRLRKSSARPRSSAWPRPRWRWSRR